LYLSQQQLAQINTFFQDKPVKKVYLFGSYADGDATEESDIDLLIESGNDFNFLKFNVQVDELKSTLNKEVDIVSIGALRPDRYFTYFVHKQKKLIYEREC
jgi:uncharacterized protein